MPTHPITRRALLGAAAAASLTAAAAPHVLAALPPRKAPQWAVSEWINGSGGNIDSLTGKVIVIDFFQLWCPGCNTFSIPLMHHWEQVFAHEAASDRLAFVSIHTVFEGHSYQSPQRLKSFLKEKGITHPVGVDRRRPGSHVPETMHRYRTSGTPEMAIIDKAGMIRFQKFGYFNPDDGERLIRALLAE